MPALWYLFLGTWLCPFASPKGGGKTRSCLCSTNPTGAGAHTQAGSWGNATPEGGVSTWEC